MCESEDPCRIQGLHDIFLRIRPCLDKLLPVFEEIDERSIVGISGKSGSGKSMLIMEIIAHILMREDSIEVLLLDTERHFKIFKFIEICMKLIKPSNIDNSNDSLIIRHQIEGQLTKLHIIKTYEADYSTLTAMLEQNQKISLVVVDSLETCYYTTAYAALEADKSLSKEYFMFSHLKKLSKLVEKFEITLVYAKPECKHDDRRFRENTTHLCTLKKDTETFTMKVHTNNQDKQFMYSINSDGIKLSASNAD